MADTTLLSRFIARTSITDVALFIGALFFLFIAVRVIEAVASWLVHIFPSRRMGLLVWVPVINFLIYFAGILTAFDVIFEPTKELLLGFAVSAILAISFAARDVASSIIAGIVLLLDKPFQVGDRVNFQDQYGEIVRIGLRSVKLMTLDEGIVTIPNQRFISEVVTSRSAGSLGMMATVEVHVIPQADLHKAKKILEEQCLKSEYVDATKPIEVVARDILTGAGTVRCKMTAKCTLKDARFEKDFQTDFTLAVNRVFAERGIKLPA